MKGVLLRGRRVYKKIMLLFCRSVALVKKEEQIDETVVPYHLVTPQHSTMVLTRSMLRRQLIQDGVRQIAAEDRDSEHTRCGEKVDLRDEGLKGRYVLVNDSRYRHELEPFVRMRLEPDMSIDGKRRFYTKLMNFMAVMENLHISRYRRTNKIPKIYPYICSEPSSLRLFPLTFRRLVYPISLRNWSWRPRTKSR